MPETEMIQISKAEYDKLRDNSFSYYVLIGFIVSRDLLSEMSEYYMELIAGAKK